jgi:endoglucanase
MHIKMKTIKLVILILISQISLTAYNQNTTYSIRLNQVGFLPNSTKVAAVINTKAETFTVKTKDLSSTVFEGKCLPPVNYASSGENVSIADFTLLQTPGDYVIVVDGLGKSVPFSIRNNVFTNLSKASIKAFYYNRASTELLTEHAGKYSRAMGHPDTAVIVLPSAASANRPAGTVISTPGGWYDAGDYNKYIVNSGISVFTLLSAYETYPAYFDTLRLNIPESSNSIPDILDEALWNIKWMMTMQDPDDGGVYNKTTEAQFSGFDMPSRVTSKRYVTAKSTAATLDFAAIMAMTARIYKRYEPELAQQALQQSLKAWQWAKNHPKVSFNNPSASGGYPAIGTGGYGDGNFEDEFSWCAAELYITTKTATYYNEIGLNKSFDIPGWPNVKTLGLLSLLIHKDSLTSDADTTLAKTKLINLVADAKNNIVNSPYRIPGDFYYWGGNNGYANHGMLFMQAFRLTQNASYFNAAVSTLDYLLGKNATGYCFVTGTGTKSPMNIHHRISGADGIAAPIPGLLVGGPNTGSISDCGASSYPSALSAKSYVDMQCSYSTNEIAINWNAPLAFLVGAVQSEYLNHFIQSMPVSLSISSRSILLPAKSGTDFQLVIEGNTKWSLSTTSEWIGLSTNNGTGTTVVKIMSNSDNLTETSRTGKIYVFNNGELADSIAVSQNGLRKNFRVEAETYSAMTGLQTEVTTDAGSGLNVGYVDIGDWATYLIDVSFSGVYDVSFRHAGYAGDFDVSIDDIFIQKITFPATADWQVWASHTAQLSLTEGQHVMKLKFNKAGTNLNWMQFNWVKALAIDDISQHDILIYPVPAEKSITIEFDASKQPNAVNLISMEGKTVLAHLCSGKQKEDIDLSGIEQGVYILKISFKSGVYTKKLLLK